MKPMGGFAGLAQAMAFATEFQGDGTPHGHGFVALVNAWQHGSLQTIADLISSGIAGLTEQEVLARLTDFLEHLNREDHFDDNAHQQQLPELERQFHRNNEGPRENIFLAARPAGMLQRQQSYLWASPHLVELHEVILAEAALFKKRYEKDVQFIFSHVQHHWHGLDKDNNRVPLKYCRLKQKVRKTAVCKCKAGFPKTVCRTPQGALRQDKYRVRIVCKGVASELQLRCSGRRNMLGAVLGRRRCAWFSGTASLLAHLFRSNTNLQTNYRLPILPSTHDADCKRPGCLKEENLKKLMLIAQRAMKAMSGYFGGYISKKQKMGQFELKKSIGALPLLKEKLQSKNLQSGSAQLAHVTNRLFTTLESKGGGGVYPNDIPI